MFSLEEQVVYPAQGVGQIERIEKQTVGGQEVRFYVIRIIANNVTVMVPVNNAKNLGLRPLCSQEEAQNVFSFFHDNAKPGNFSGQNWNKRYREYTEKLKSASLVDVAFVVKELLLINGAKDLSFGERRLLEQAMCLITSEVSLVLNQTAEAIQSQIEEIFAPFAKKLENSA